MCYWRRLSKRSVDNSDFEYTDDRNLTDQANDSGRVKEPVISDSLSLFKALQVRQEPVEPARARQRAQTLQEMYAEDEEPQQLVCYRHAEVLVFLLTLGVLLLLFCAITITCCLRLRKFSRAHQHQSHQKQQFCHSRLAGALSPALLSIGDTLSSVSAGSGPSTLGSAAEVPKRQAQKIGSNRPHSASKGHPFSQMDAQHHRHHAAFAYDR